MTHKRTLRWVVEQFDRATERLVCEIPLPQFDVDTAREIWDVYGHLEFEESFYPDWWLIYCYPVSPQHQEFLGSFTDHVFDFVKNEYFLTLESTDGPDNELPDIPDFVWSRMKYKGKVGEPIEREGQANLVRRWHLEDGRILEWDPDAFRADLYTPEGEHLGEFDPVNGALIGPPQPGSRVEP